MEQSRSKSESTEGRDQSVSPLSGSVLVLNRFYMAVHIVSVRRALVMLYRELAEVIDVQNGQYFNYSFDEWLEVCEFEAFEISESENHFEKQDWVRSSRTMIRVPKIIRLSFYDKVPQLSLKFNRRNLFARDKNTCQYCGQSHPLSALSFDHIVPRSRGGQTSWENVVCCCLKCNGRKGDRLPEEAGMSLIRPPTKPKSNPVMQVKLNNPRYATWRTFLKGSPIG